MKKRPENEKELNDLAAFLPESDAAYQKWREKKLAGYDGEAITNIVKVRDLSQPDGSVISAVISGCAKFNMVIYELENGDSCDGEGDQRCLRANLKTFCAKVGLHDAETNRSQGDDGVVAIKVDNQGIGAGYIPYTNRRLSWHTDGYYNASDDRIHAMVLHCARDASEGGVNELLDPEIAYIRLRDSNPAFVRALMHEEAMCIPENKDARSAYRAASIGPVFFFDKIHGALSMRYTARTRNIVWRDDCDTDKARAALSELLREDPLIVRHKLKPGQGIISNNVLHNRTAFVDSKDAPENIAGRLLYRIRYKQRVSQI